MLVIAGAVARDVSQVTLRLRFALFADPTEDGPQVMIQWDRLRDLLEPKGPARFLRREAKGSGLK